MKTWELIALDPAKHDCALAAGDGDRLEHVADVVTLAEAWSGYCAQRVVWEKPQGDGRRVPVEDLIEVTANGALTASAIHGDNPTNVEAFQPRDWKGSVPKPIHHSRVWEVLDVSEREILGGTATSDAIDAACLRGAQDKWRKPGATYYHARELPKLASGLKITHDILDAAALYLTAVGRLSKGKTTTHGKKTRPARSKVTRRRSPAKPRRS